MNRRPRPRRVYLTSARAHKETMKALARFYEIAHETQQAQESQTTLLRRIFRKVGKIMAAMEDLEAAVTRIEGVSDSIVVLLTELSKEIANLQNNTQAKALADRVNAKADALAAAALANPDPTPDPTPAPV